MSANNWGVCPRCAARVREADQQLIREMKESYGKVTPSEYLSLVERCKIKPELDYKLREDYQLGLLETGEFFVHYECFCETCRFNYKYNYKVILSWTD